MQDILVHTFSYTFFVISNTLTALVSSLNAVLPIALKISWTAGVQQHAECVFNEYHLEPLAKQYYSESLFAAERRAAPVCTATAALVAR